MLISFFLVDRATVADIPSLALTPGLVISKVQAQCAHRDGQWPAASRVLGWGVRPRGLAGAGGPHPPLAALPRDLPSLPHLGSGKPETLAHGWPGRLLHWESCRWSELGRGIQLPFFRLPESRLSSGGWTSALASSRPAGRPAGGLWLQLGGAHPQRCPCGLEGAGGRRAAQG